MKIFTDSFADILKQLGSCSSFAVTHTAQSMQPENLTLECVVSIEELRTLLQKPLLNEKEIEFVEREYLSQIDKPTFSLEVKVTPSSAKTTRVLKVGATLEQFVPKQQSVCASPCQHCEDCEWCPRNLL